MKNKTFLFLFFVISSVFAQEDLVLVPMNPLLIRDDMFNITIDIGLNKPVQTKPWVKFQSDSWSKIPMSDLYVVKPTDKSHKTELRLFAIKEDATYEEIRSSIRKLLVIGFRPTSLLHLVAFSNTENAKNLNAGVLIIASTRPELKLEDKSTLSLKAFYGAVTKGDGIVVGVIMPDDIKYLETKILILEPPDFNL